MDVLHISKVYWPVKGGVQSIVRRIVEGVVGRYLSAVLTTADVEEDCLEHGVRVIRAKALLEVSSMPISLSFAIKLFHSVNQCRVVCLHYPFPLTDFLLSFIRKKNSWVVYWHSEIVSQKFLKHAIKPFTHLMLKKSDVIVVSSPEIIEHSNFLQKHRDKCRVIPFGYKRTHEIPDNKRENIELKLLSIGRHVPYKGFDVLINAMKHSQNKLTIVGSGPLYAKHKALIESFGLSDRIMLITGLDDEQVLDQIQGCDALVLPSIYPSEAFALVQIEAMAYGKPIINTKLESGVPWVARHNKEALTVSPGSVDELADAINKLEMDRDLYERLADGALKRYEAVFTYEEFIKKTSDLYADLISSEGWDNQ